MSFSIELVYSNDRYLNELIEENEIYFISTANVTNFDY